MVAVCKQVMRVAAVFAALAISVPASHAQAAGVSSLPPAKLSKASAPVANSQISGSIKEEESGKPVVNATVSFRRLGDNKEIEVQTNERGEFMSPPLRAGDYTVTVSAQGLLAKSKRVKLATAENSAIDFLLSPMETADVLRVTGQRMLTHPEKIGSTTHLDKKYLEQIGNGNDLRKVIETTPGIMPDSVGNIITRGEHNAVNYTIDGAVLPEAAGVLQQGQFASPRSLQAVDVDIGGCEASDGGGPLGAIVRMRSMPVQAKPVWNWGTQIGGPMSGGINYYGATALSQDTNSIFNRIRVESSGSIFASKIGIQPGTKKFVRDAKLDINSMSKVVFDATDRDRFTLLAAVNETYLHQPTSPLSRSFGVKINEHDRQNYVMLSYRHRFERFFDEANLHFINAFYSQHIWQTNAFDPNPIINGDGYLRSAAVNARRYNYAFSAQGDISKTVFKTHKIVAGFLSEVRPVRTQLSEAVYDADPTSPTYSLMISPFNGLPVALGNPSFIGNMGKYHGFRWIQSAYIQDTWKPTRGWLRRLTLDYGARFDLDHGVFGNSMGIAEAIAAIPGTPPFNLDSFKKQTLTNAQLSGRYGGTFAITKTTIARASFSNIFVPAPVDVFLTPFDITGGPSPFNGIWQGAPRPMQAMRGRLVDVGVEQQFSRRLVLRNNLFYKKLYHFGDSGVIDNSLVYNRLTNNLQEAYGAETRLELKPARNGTGMYGFVSNTFAVAYLRGSRKNDGGFWDVTPLAGTSKYPDHDRREVVSAAFGYRNQNSFWILAQCQAYTGVKNELNPAIFGPHPARVAPYYLVGLNCGLIIPQRIRRDHSYCPASIEVRIENLTNNRAAINLGSPYQGTRYATPIRVLACVNWQG